MGILDVVLGKKGSKRRRRSLKGVAKTRRSLKLVVGGYTPAYGTKRTFAGYKLTPKQEKVRAKERKKTTKATKRVLRRAWRRLI